MILFSFPLCSTQCIGLTVVVVTCFITLVVCIVVMIEVVTLYNRAPMSFPIEQTEYILISCVNMYIEILCM